MAMLIRLVEFANWENGKYLRNILQTYTKHKITAWTAIFRMQNSR